MPTRKNLLLLTATIQPKPGQPSLVILDPAVRLQEYEAALAFYAGLLEQDAIDGIVFAENSGFDLAALAAKFPSPSIEWLSVPGLDYPIDYHRGYGEFKLVDGALERSRLVAQAGDDGVVWKVSGRYVVKNLQSVVRWAPRRLDYYGSVRSGWAEMSVLAWSGRGHRDILQGLWQRFATAEPPELILARRLREPHPAASRIVTSFHWPPFIVGRRGTDGGNFQGRRTKYKFWLVMTERVLTLPLRRLLSH